MKGKLIVAGTLVALIVALACGQEALQSRAEANQANMVEVPLFEVDPTWPMPMPNNWLLGSTIGVGVDSRDHVFIVHRPESLNERTEANAPHNASCCFPAPPVVEFDPEGNLVSAWGGEDGEGYTWPSSNHGITVDPNDNLWIGGNGFGDSHVLKFSRNGDFLMQVGEPGQEVNSLSTAHFSRVAKVSFGPDGDEAYVSDGYGHKRVAVIDSETGEFLRYWGAYGNEPSDENLGPYDPDAPLAQQFRNPVHCAEPSDDGLVYVCDRPNNRIQVFETDGTFVDEQQYAPETLGDGAVWDIAFSGDPDQRFIYLADGANRKVYVIERESLEVLTQFGAGGRQPGQFFAVHSIATDSEGNVYTTETYEGKRIQKFVYLGMGQVERGSDQGVVWPGTVGQ